MKTIKFPIDNEDACAFVPSEIIIFNDGLALFLGEELGYGGSEHYEVVWFYFNPSTGDKIDPHETQKK